MKAFTKAFTKALLTIALVVTMLAPSFAVTVNAAKIVTPASGYTSASQVEYVKTGKYVHNWGARGEDATFLSTYATNFYTGDDVYSEVSKKAGGTTQSNAPQSALYSELASVMKDKHSHQTSYGETRDLYKYTDCVLNDSSKLSSFYSGAMVNSTWDSGNTYNREHTWPNSKGLAGNDENDIMMLRPTVPTENGSRGNKAYGASGNYFNPGESVHGDVARIFLYVYVRWGNVNYAWGQPGVMENLTVLLRWMEEDPVDTWEMGRNDAVQSITGTRNIFVDYPEYAWLLFGQEVPTDMVTPSGLAKSGQAGGSGGGEELPPVEGDLIIEDLLKKDTLTVAEANAIGNSLAHDTTTEKLFYVTGKIISITNAEYGNMIIKGEKGDTITVYGSYDSTGEVKYGSLEDKPVVGDTVKFYSVVGNYNDPQLKNARIMEVTKGEQSEDGEYDDPTMLALFDFGEKGSEAHSDGAAISNGTSYTVGDYTLTINNVASVYGGAFDAKGNSCLKIGTGKKVGGFEFTVPNDVLKVTFKIAQYKSNTSKVTINGVSTTISTASNMGEYTAVTVDTSSNKTVKFATASTSTPRVMIDSISYHGEAKAPDQGGEDEECKHANTQEIPAVGATCTATGLTAGKKCADCGEILVKQEVTPKTGHTEVIDKAVAPTCQKEGLTEGKHCSVCNEVLVKQEAVEKTAHTEVVDKAVAPTCQKEGLTEGKHCSVCNEVLVKQEAVEKLAHEFVYGVCTACGEEDPSYVPPAVEDCEHAYGEWVVVKEATTSESGLKEKTCPICKHTIQERIPPVEGGASGSSFSCNASLGGSTLGFVLITLAGAVVVKKRKQN